MIVTRSIAIFRPVRVPSACVLAVVLATALVMALAANVPHAFAAGTVTTQSGEREAYADILMSELESEVQVIECVAGDSITLSGDFNGGWGTVQFEWAHYNPDRTHGSAYALAGQSGHDAQSGQGEQDGQAAQGDQSAQASEWEVVSSSAVSGLLPERNAAVRAGGKTQTLQLQGVEEGSDTYRLTATDEVGYSHSIYYQTTVEPTAMPNATEAAAPTNTVSSDIELRDVRSIVDGLSVNAVPAVLPIGNNAPGATDNATADNTMATENAVPNNTASNNAVPSNAASNNAATDSAPGKAGMPQTGDQVMRFATFAAVIAVAAAIAATIAFAARRRNARTQQ